MRLIGCCQGMNCPMDERLPSAVTYNAPQHAAAHTSEYLYHQLIPYLGNKRKLLRLIAQAAARTGISGGTFVDLFAGSGVVARWAKQQGFRVLANDWEPYAEVINQCHIACNHPPRFAALGGMEAVFHRLNTLSPLADYITAHLCPANDSAPDPVHERLFFTRENGMHLDAIREQIKRWDDAAMLTLEERAVLLAALLYAASYVSNTSGVFKGYHHGWGGRTGTALYRIRSELQMRPPVFWDNGHHNRTERQDAQSLAEALQGEMVEIAYLDPPYNQHPYGSNYHVLNTLTLWDKPPVGLPTCSGSKAAIRTDWRTLRRSAYNHRATASDAYRRLLQALQARFILTSYSTEGTIPLHEMLTAACARGKTECVSKAYKRYRVSSQRPSSKPQTLEFVLITDTSRRANATDPEMIAEQLKRSDLRE